MSYLLDTNVLLRFVNESAAEHPLVSSAVEKLRKQGEHLCLTPQNLIELWGVMTRPVTNNGLGVLPAEVDQSVRELFREFDLLEDDPTILMRWQRLVSTHAVLGRQVHDARLVAVMLTYGVTHLLTFNGQDFTRYPGIQVVHPAQV